MSDPKRPLKHKTQRPNLSAREVRFCVAFVEHDNITRAHREAGFEAASDNAHTVAGRKLLRKAQIRAYIRELQTEAMDEARVTVNKIVQGLARCAFADRLGVFDERGNVRPKSEWPDDVRGAIEGIETEELYEVVTEKGQPKRRVLRGFARKIRTAKRVEALKVLAQLRGLIGKELPPLDQLLAALPPNVAAVVRQALGRALDESKNSTVIEVELGPEVVPPPIGGEASLDNV